MSLPEPDIVDTEWERWWIVPQSHHHSPHRCQVRHHEIAKTDRQIYLSYVGFTRCMQHPPTARGI